MEHAVSDWGATAFWLFIAAAAVAGHWERSRRNSEKHETMRRIIEKTGAVDEAKLKELFSKPGVDWTGEANAYRGLRIAGTVVLSVAAGLAVLFIGMGAAGVIPAKAMYIGLSCAGGVTMVGIGLFASSRFAEPPPDTRGGYSER
jgi:hypothetical protein